MMAYCIASTFSDKTAFQGWEVQRHTQHCPQESIQACVVSFLAFILVWIWGRGIIQSNLEVPAEKATGPRQAKMEACRLWNPALVCPSIQSVAVSVKFCKLLLVSAACCNWSWWMSVVHPQHLASGRIGVESGPRMETDKKGDFLLNRSKDWTTQG